ncbi:hypothetical protein AN1V17_40050 [Vallitalea sediminicola]
MKVKDYFISGSINQIIKKEELFFLIGLIEHPKLVRPFIDYPKKYKHLISGFRPNKLPRGIINQLYYNGLFKHNDTLLEEVFSNLIEGILMPIDLEIMNQMDGEDDEYVSIRKRMTGAKTDNFIEYVNGLLNTCFIDRILLFFKLISIELDEECISYIQVEVEEKKKAIELERKYEKKYRAEVERKLAYYEKEHLKKIQLLEDDIKKLKEDGKHTKENHREELSSKDKENGVLRKSINDLKDDNTKIMTQLNKQVEESKEFIDVLQLGRELHKVEIQELQARLALKDNEYKKIAYDKWLVEHEEQVKAKEKAENEIHQLTSTIEDMKNKAEQLEMERAKSEDVNGKLKNNTRDLIEGIKSAVQMLGISEELTNQHIDLIIEDIQLRDEEEDYTDDILDFIYDLQTNLAISGVEEDMSLNMAKYICSSIILEKSILLVGNNSRDITNALSNVYCSADAAVLTVPQGFNDVKRIEEIIESTQSKVILIEQLLDNSFENIYYPLLKRSNSKMLVFSLESLEMIKLLPSGILGYLTLLNIDNSMTFKRNEELIKASVNKDIFKKNIELSDKKEALERLIDFKKVLSVSKIAMLEIAKVTAVLQKLSSKSDSITSIVIFYISLIFDSHVELDVLLGVLSELDIADVDIQKIKQTLELENE